jgi:PAS domain S-box-containing protein
LTSLETELIPLGTVARRAAQAYADPEVESQRRLHELLPNLPAPIYITDADGRITFFNEAAAAFWGCRPKLDSDQWCRSWRMYRPDGTPLPHDECPIAVALKERRAIYGEEAVAERPDGTRVPFMAFPSPLHDHAGTCVGAMNMLVDISERKQTHDPRSAQGQGTLRLAPDRAGVRDYDDRGPAGRT